MTPVELWAASIIAVVIRQEDVCAVAAWAAILRCSSRTLERRCELVGTTAKESLDFARLAPSLLVANPNRWYPQDCMETADPRTVAALLSRAGLSCFVGKPRPSVATLMERNMFGIRHEALEAVRERLTQLGESPTDTATSPRGNRAAP